MADHRASISTFASQLEDEFEAIQVLDHYELNEISTLSDTAQPVHNNVEETEVQGLLDESAQAYVLEQRYFPPQVCSLRRIF